MGESDLIQSAIYQDEQAWTALVNEHQMINLRHFLALSEEKTTGALGIPGDTEKSHLHRALKRLHLCLGQNEPTFDEEFSYE